MVTCGKCFKSSIDSASSLWTSPSITSFHPWGSLFTARSGTPLLLRTKCRSVGVTSSLRRCGANSPLKGCSVWTSMSGFGSPAACGSSKTMGMSPLSNRPRSTAWQPAPNIPKLASSAPLPTLVRKSRLVVSGAVSSQSVKEGLWSVFGMRVIYSFLHLSKHPIRYSNNAVLGSPR